MNAPVVNVHPAAPAVLTIFALTYLGMAVGRVPGLKLNRTGIALLGAIAMMVFAGLPTSTVIGFINWPTVLLLFAFFVLSAQLRLSGFFDRVAQGISQRLDHPARFLLVLMLAAAGLSALLNNDVVCFVFAPIVGSAVLSRRLNPVPYLVALAAASNLGAAATLVGNPQGMLIAQVAGLGFGDYAAWCLPPVLAALGCAYALIRVMARPGERTPVPAPPADNPSRYSFNRAHTGKGLVILGLVIAFFFSPVPREIVALTAAGLHLASRKFRTDELLGLVNWPILILFMGLFVVTGAFQASGYGDEAARWLASTGCNLQSPPTLALVTAGLSNLINNSAAVLLLVKVVNLANPTTAYVLALANSFGGCLIVSGSVANIIVVQQARDLGVEITFGEFARLGVPVGLAALGCLIAWVAVMG